jgi:hypothetical protein
MKRINSMKKRRRKEVTVSDRTLASVGPACPVSDSSEGAGVGLRLDAGIESDLMHRGLSGQR